MLRLIFAFVDIALHRRGPDHLPGASFLLWFVLAVNLAVALANAVISNLVPHPVFMTAVETALALAFVWSVLKAFERERRFRQTACAMLGTNILFNLIALPLTAWRASIGATPTEVSIPQVLYVLVSIWSIDVAAFILARALDRPYLLGVAIMIGYLLLSLSVSVSLVSSATS